MRLSVVLVAVAIFVASVAAYSPVSQLTETGFFVLKGVDVINVNTGLIEPQANIWMQGGRILYVGLEFPAANITNTVIDYSMAGNGFGHRFFAVPGFVNVQGSMSLRSVLSSASEISGINQNVVTSLTATGNDFVSNVAAPAAGSTVQERFNNVYKPILQANLAAGVTTWVDSISNSAEFIAVRDTQIGNTVVNYPNMYTFGPAIGVARGFPAFADGFSNGWKVGVPVSTGATEINTMIASLNTTLNSMFMNGAGQLDALGAMIVADYYEYDQTTDATGSIPIMNPAMVSAITSAVVGYGRKAAFVSTIDVNTNAAIMAGARLKMGAPIVSHIADCTGNASQCQLSQEAANMNFYGVWCTTGLSPIGAASVYMTAPATITADKRSYFNYGMPATISGAYTSLLAAQGAIFNTGLAYSNQMLASYTDVVRRAYQQGMKFAVGVGAGLPWAIHGTPAMEAQLASNAGLNALWSLTQGAANSVGLGYTVGSLDVGKYSDVLIMANNPLNTAPNQWEIVNVYKFGFQQPDVGIKYNLGIAMALAAVGFAIILVVLFVTYTICCGRRAAEAKRGDVSHSVL